jgi:hypothetical protein
MKQRSPGPDPATRRLHRDLGVQRAFESVHRCGPRPCAELLDLAGADEGLLDRVLIWAARLEPEIVRAIGADRFQRPWLSSVPSFDLHDHGANDHAGSFTRSRRHPATPQMQRATQGVAHQHPSREKLSVRTTGASPEIRPRRKSKRATAEREPIPPPGRPRKRGDRTAMLNPVHPRDAAR